MKKFLFAVFLLLTPFSIFAAISGGGVLTDSIQVSSLSGDHLTFVASKNQFISSKAAPAYAPHSVGSINQDKLHYEIFDFETGGYVATLVGWADSNDYYPDLKIPNTVKYEGKDVPVTTINDFAFTEGWGITSVKIGGNVKSIGQYAFYHCSLSQLYIPISVERIMYAAFAYNHLDSVSFQNPGQKSPALQIKNAAFGGLYIENFEVPARLDPSSYLLTDRINFLAPNPYLSKITLNPATGVWSAPTKSASGVAECAFEIVDNALCVATGSGEDRVIVVVAYPAANEATSFSLSDNIIEVNTDAFQGTSLKSVALTATAPASLQLPKVSLLAYSFSNNPDLSSFSINAQGNIDLGPGAIDASGSLESITLGSGIANYKEINGAFYQTVDGELTLAIYPSGKKDKTFVVPDGVKNIGVKAMSANVYVEEVVHPEGIRNIDEGAYYDCLSLRKANLPSSLESIGSLAFAHSRLDEITLPAGLKYLESDAFLVGQTLSYPDHFISKVTVLSSTPPLSSTGKVATEIFNDLTLAKGKLILPDGVQPSVFTSNQAWNFSNVAFAGIDRRIADSSSDFTIVGRRAFSPDGSELELLTADGKLIARGKSVSAPAAGIYIIRSSKRTLKTYLR